MRRILNPGNSEGYILLDAIIALFIASITIAAVFGSVATIVRLSAKNIERAVTIIDSRNESVEKILTPDEK